MAEIAQLRELNTGEARQRLIALAREQGPAALAMLRAALADPALVEAAAEALGEIPDQEAWDLLAHLAQTSRSALRKAARRAQHRLRSQGFRPAPSEPRPEAVPTLELAHASSFDMSGHQLLRLVRSAPLGLVRYANFVVGIEGLHECRYILMDRSGFDVHIARENDEIGQHLIEMGLAYIARRARQGAARSRTAGKALPRDWPATARLLENAPEDTVLPEIAADAASETPATPAEIARLLDHPSMANWVLNPNRLARYARDWLRLVQYQPVRTAEGLLNLSAIQSRGQFTGRVIADLGDAALFSRLAEQLAEQARMLYALGERELASIARRCAAGFEKHPGPNDPFLPALVEQSMEVAAQALQDAEAKANQGPWVPAGDPSSPLWVPRPAEPEPEKEKKPAPRLWLPGQS